MGPKTIFYLEVPLEGVFSTASDGRPLREKKRHWHEHVNFFSPASLKAMAHRSSLKVLAEKTLSVSLGGRETMVQMLVCKLS
jgi:hypothetical protein